MEGVALAASRLCACNFGGRIHGGAIEFLRPYVRPDLAAKRIDPRHIGYGPAPASVGIIHIRVPRHIRGGTAVHGNQKGIDKHIRAGPLPGTQGIIGSRIRIAGRIDFSQPGERRFRMKRRKEIVVLFRGCGKDKHPFLFCPLYRVKQHLQPLILLLFPGRGITSGNSDYPDFIVGRQRLIHFDNTVNHTGIFFPGKIVFPLLFPAYHIIEPPEIELRIRRHPAVLSRRQGCERRSMHRTRLVGRYMHFLIKGQL